MSTDTPAPRRRFAVHGFALEYDGDSTHVWTSLDGVETAHNMTDGDRPIDAGEALECVIDGENGPGYFAVVQIDGETERMLATFPADVEIDGDHGLARAMYLVGLLAPRAGEA